MMPNPADEPKLIIDEDWKTQVQREKEELKQKLEAEAAPADSASTHDTSLPERHSTAETNSSPLEAPPPASFTLLVTTLATQAMAAMGLMPSDTEDAPDIRLDFAKHFIDMLAVLEQKTAGNLNDAEKAYLQDALHQLRMAFVAVSKQAAR